MARHLVMRHDLKCRHYDIVIDIAFALAQEVEGASGRMNKQSDKNGRAAEAGLSVC
jgi:hypothetical protein